MTVRVSELTEDVSPSSDDYVLAVDNATHASKKVTMGNIVTVANAATLALKAPLASPTFTGTVTVPTPSNTTDATTKTYVDTQDALKLAKASNLSDLASAATARTNLGLGTLATQSGTFSGTSSGTNTGDQTLSDATIATTDITTNNVSISKHGFAPKAPNDATKYLDGTGSYSVPAGSGGGSGDMVLASAQTVTGAKTFNAGTLLDKGSQVYNVKAYGAVGDGTTDDGAAINLALTAAQATSGIVLIPQATYLINTQIAKDSGNVTIIGAGKGKTILKAGASLASGNSIISIGNGTGPTVRNNIHVQGITFDMNTTASTWGLSISWCAHVTIRDIAVINPSTTSFSMLFLGLFSNMSSTWDATDIAVEDSYFDYNGVSNNWEGITLGYARDVRLRNCTFINKAAKAMLMNYNSEEVTVTDCRFNLAPFWVNGRGPTHVNGADFISCGIQLEAGDHLNVHNSSFQGVTADATAGRVVGIDIRGYYIPIGATEYPFYITLPYTWNAKSVIVDGNSFDHPTPSSVFASYRTSNSVSVLDANDVTFTNNIVSNSQTKGVSLFAKYLILVGNRISNSAQFGVAGDKQNYMIAATRGVFSSNQSYDDQGSPTTLRDVVIDNELVAGLIPTQNWQLGVNDFNVTGSQSYYDSGFTTTKPAAITISSVVWGAITGTLANQTDLNTALGLKAPLASPTFTGTVTTPSLDLKTGSDASGSGGSPIPIEYNGGGYKHWIRTKHDTSVATNGIEFFLNTSATSGGSSAPGTGNVQTMGLYGNGRVGMGTSAPLEQLDINGASPGITLRYGAFPLSSFRMRADSFQWQLASNSGSDAAPTWTDRLVVSNNGAVAITSVNGTQLTLNSTGNAAALVSGFDTTSAAEIGFGYAGSRYWHMGRQGDGSFAFVETGVAVRLTIAAGGAMANAGSIKSSDATGGVGYATGAGGTVTQATSKSTGVTLNKASGAITLNAAALAASTTVSFTLTNSAIAATDVLVMNHISGGTAGSYTITPQAAAGSATINVRNVSLGSLSEAIVLQFAVVKAVST